MNITTLLNYRLSIRSEPVEGLYVVQQVHHKF